MPDYRVVHYYLDGWRLMVAGPSRRKWIHGVIFDSGQLSLTKIRKEEERHFRDPPGKPHKYKLHRVVNILLMTGRKYGMTDGAKDFLKEALDGPA